MMRLLVFVLMAVAAFGDNLYQAKDCEKDGEDSNGDDSMGTCKKPKLKAKQFPTKNDLMNLDLYAKSVRLREGSWCVTVAHETFGPRLIALMGLLYGPKVAYTIVASGSYSDTDEFCPDNDCSFGPGGSNISIEAFSPFTISFVFWPGILTLVGKKDVTMTPGACDNEGGEGQTVILDGSHGHRLLSCSKDMTPLRCQWYRDLGVVDQGSDVAAWDNPPFDPLDWDQPLDPAEAEPFLEAFPVDNDDVERHFLSSDVITMREKPGCLWVWTYIWASSLRAIVVYVQKAGSPVEEAVAHELFQSTLGMRVFQLEEHIPVSFKHVKLTVEFRGPWTWQGSLFVDDISKAGMDCDKEHTSYLDLQGY